MTAPPWFAAETPCSGLDFAFFRPEGQPNYEYLPMAQAICGNCPEVAPCLKYALAHDVEGVWAGTTEATRNFLRRKHRLPPPEPLLTAADFTWFRTAVGEDGE
jgi:hypothetical protein